MRESIGLSYIVGFIATFFGIFIILFTGSLSYSKAFKAKNNIINILEKNECYGGGSCDSEDEIGVVLKDIGYRIKNGKYNYQVTTKNVENGVVYTVTTYMYFDFPVIGDHLEIPVSGQTRTIY